MNEHDYVSKKLSLQIQAAGCIWPVDHNLERDSSSIINLNLIHHIYKYILNVLFFIFLYNDRTSAKFSNKKIVKRGINRKIWIYCTKPGNMDLWMIYT